MKTNTERVYPEVTFGGFSRCDGTIPFLVRAHSLAPSAGMVLDIGCGRGEGFYDKCASRAKFSNFRAQGRHVIGIDVDQSGKENPMIDEFRAIANDGAWPIDSSSIDFAVCRSVIEHVPDVPHFFSELVRVLKPGGFFAAHTSNVLSYPGIAACLIPNRYHSSIVAVAQEGRQERDVFPTLYRCNTVWKIRHALRDAGLRGVVYGIEAEPAYLEFSTLTYRLGAMLSWAIPSCFASRLIIFAEKPKVGV